MILYTQDDITNEIVKDVFVTLSDRQNPIPSNTYSMEIYDSGFDVEFDIYDHSEGASRANLFNIQVVEDSADEDLTDPQLIKPYVPPGEYKYTFTNVNSDVLEWGIFKVEAKGQTSSSYNYNPPQDKSWI